MRGSSYTVPLTLPDAIENRNALAKVCLLRLFVFWLCFWLIVKEIYAALFEWLVTKLNEKLLVTQNPDLRFIGVLDIYGFEVFKTNRYPESLLVVEVVLSPIVWSNFVLTTLMKNFINNSMSTCSRLSKKST